MKNTHKNYTKKYLNDLDNHDGMIIHLEPDMLECEFKWALESINSLAFSLLYGPTLTSVHDYWKNYSFDYTDFVGKVTSLLFLNPA